MSDPGPVVVQQAALPPTIQETRMASVTTSLSGGVAVAVLAIIARMYHVDIPPELAPLLGAAVAAAGVFIAHRAPPPLTPEQHKALADAIIARIAR